MVEEQRPAGEGQREETPARGAPPELSSPSPSGTPPRPASGTGLQPNVAGLLCYVLTWVTGLIFLLLEKEDRFVRFHAFQAIDFGVLWTVFLIVTSFIPAIGPVLAWLGSIAGIVVWVVLMVRAYQGQTWRLPVIGDHAARFAGLEG